MSGSKRQRELARAKYERQQARRSANANKRKRNQRIVAAVVVVGLVFASIAWAVLNSRSGSELAAPAISPSPAASASSAASPAASPAASDATASDAAASESSLLNCAPPGTVRPDDITFSAAPSTGTAASLTLATNCGDVVIALDPKAPKTVASEVFLAKNGFYDNTECHRLTTAGIFVLQCGDPTGQGNGGPGYVVPDENLPAEGGVNYPAGTIAMANAGPGTSGSQFFIVYEDTTLPASYSIWGSVTSGLDIVKEIASAGVADGGTDGPPAQPVFIESATVQS